MRARAIRTMVAVAVLALSAAGWADNSGVITVNASASGWYAAWNPGATDPQLDTNAKPNSLQNYVAWNDGYIVNNFFVFDLAGVTGPIISPSELNLLIPAQGVYAPNGSLTYTLFDVSTPVSDLLAGVPSSSILDDLGSGISFGSAVVTESDNGTVFVVSFNQAGIAALNSSLGGLFAIGGSITSGTGYAFGYTGGQVPYLTLDPPSVPEPASLVLFGSGLIGLATCMRSKRRRG